MLKKKKLNLLRANFKYLAVLMMIILSKPKLFLSTKMKEHAILFSNIALIKLSDNLWKKIKEKFKNKQFGKLSDRF